MKKIFIVLLVMQLNHVAFGMNKEKCATQGGWQNSFEQECCGEACYVLAVTSSLYAVGRLCANDFGLKHDWVVDEHEPRATIELGFAIGCAFCSATQYAEKPDHSCIRNKCDKCCGAYWDNLCWKCHYAMSRIKRGHGGGPVLPQSQKMK